MAHVVLEEWHAQPPHHFLLLIAHDLALTDVDIVDGVVEVFELELETDEGFGQSNGFLHVEVSAFAGEDFVGFFLHDEDEVSCHCVGLNKRVGTISLPSPLRVIACPWKAPFSTGTSMIFSFVTIFFPWQLLHLPPSPMISPSPRQASQAF